MLPAQSKNATKTTTNIFTDGAMQLWNMGGNAIFYQVVAMFICGHGIAFVIRSAINVLTIIQEFVP